MRRVDRGASPEFGVFKTDFDKQVILRSFERRGWQRVRSEDDEDWDLYWASVHTVRSIFNPENGRRLLEHQIINHYPNHYELTRKDLMARNIKRYRKDRERQVEQLSNMEAAGFPQPAVSSAAIDEHEMPADWVPTTFALPSDYAIFVEEFRRHPNATWIAKPTGQAQGRGIFLVSKLNQLKKWSGGQKPFNQSLFREPYIISKYINDPLLVGGKKFDLRVYVLVTNYRPLKAYLYRGGFCRFCVEQYSSNVAEIDNVFVHLTNVAVQKNAEDYNDRHGGKWDIHDLLLFVEGTRGAVARDKLMTEMEAVLVHSLKAVQGVMINDRHCFEMYGFDILLDASLKPWLLEVNASPSLSTTTDADRILKTRLIHDMLGIVLGARTTGAQADGPHAGGADCSSAAGELSAASMGGFYCLIDEGRQQQLQQEEARLRASRNARKQFGASRAGTGSNWR